MSAIVNPNAGQLDVHQILQRGFDELHDKFRVDASVSVTSITGDVVVDIDAATGDNIAIANADGSLKATITVIDTHNALDTNIVGISSGGNSLAINPDGSLNVDISGFSTIVNTYNEVTSVASGVLTTIVSKTMLSPGALVASEVSGTNIAEYTIEINSIVVAKARSYFGGSLNYNYDFKGGISLTPGDVIRARVIHNRPMVGDFNARLETTG